MIGVLVFEGFSTLKLSPAGVGFGGEVRDEVMPPAGTKNTAAICVMQHAF